MAFLSGSYNDSFLIRGFHIFIKEVWLPVEGEIQR